MTLATHLRLHSPTRYARLMALLEMEPRETVDEDRVRAEIEGLGEAIKGDTNER